jgi:hypothetical protein
MKFSALDIPDSNADLAGWLEQHLVGVELADVIAGLEVFRHETGDAPALDTVLNGRQPAVLDQGLAALTEPQLISLLRHPRLLLPLQERVLTYGGRYWQDQPISPEQRRLIEAGWAAVSDRTSPASTRPPVAAGGGIPTRRTPWAKVLSIAALVLVAVFGWRQFQSPTPTPPGWGWDKPGALASNLPARDYLNSLADAANDWFKKRPDDAAALRSRIEQFRAGCDTLIAAPHTPLAAADRDWLRERCAVWRGKLDGHLAALQAGQSVEEVRDAADATISKLMTAIRDRAATVG